MQKSERYKKKLFKTKKNSRFSHSSTKLFRGCFTRARQYNFTLIGPPWVSQAFLIIKKKKKSFFNLCVDNFRPIISVTESHEGSKNGGCEILRVDWLDRHSESRSQLHCLLNKHNNHSLWPNWIKRDWIIFHGSILILIFRFLSLFSSYLFIGLPALRNFGSIRSVAEGVTVFCCLYRAKRLFRYWSVFYS